MDRKPVWINGRQVYLLPWARGWDALLAAGESDLRDVWNGRAFIVDEFGRRLSPEDGVRSGQKIVVRRIAAKDPLEAPSCGLIPLPL